MARTIYALDHAKLTHKPFYMLTLTISGSWRKYEDRYQWKSRLKYAGIAVDDVKSLVLWLCQQQSDRRASWEVRTTVKENIRDQYTVEYTGITSSSDELPSNVAFAEGVLRYVEKRFGEAAIAVDDVKSLVLWLCQQQSDRSQRWEVRSTVKENIRDQYTVEYTGVTSRSNELPSNVAFAEGVLRYVEKRFGEAAVAVGFRYLMPVYQQALLGRWKQRLFQRLFRAYGKSPYLSLIHISEPTRPY